jgi:hypothetical protein
MKGRGAGPASWRLSVSRLGLVWYSYVGERACARRES